jgi:hypothetical protein
MPYKFRTHEIKLLQSQFRQQLLLPAVGTRTILKVFFNMDASGRKNVAAGHELRGNESLAAGHPFK